ncbi:alpha/beta hydrolase [Edaphobacter dinghuensis]|uniref:Phospholipase n=1 Tax=Edaphobacter dinghuensis TaxID=1560005 RepID=A0A917HBG0_9BACT|nr:alpha/beta hydrolase [Edaphobacter dinghuensis]GGG73447.1 phospholipase [Edaphobacter dinghuensis]
MPRPAAKTPKRRPQPTPQPETVDPRWLVKAIAATIGVAILCGYLALCLLFYQGQWQLVLHPTRTTSVPASINGAPYELLHFGPDDSAIPQLTGWWIPAAPQAPYANLTLLFLPPGDGSLADSIPTLATLHNLGINIFAFDYRGYGQSANTHPTQQRMAHDADSAWTYLTTSRDVPTNRIIPYGTGAGASLAASLATTHSTIPALILDSPHTDLLDTARRDPRSSLLPVALLFHETFPLTAPLQILHTPKLLLSKSSQSPAAYRTAADPKITVEFTTPTEAVYTQALTRFLDKYAPNSQQLVPTPAPAH